LNGKETYILVKLSPKWIALSENGKEKFLRDKIKIF